MHRNNPLGHCIATRSFGELYEFLIQYNIPSSAPCTHTSVWSVMSVMTRTSIDIASPTHDYGEYEWSDGSATNRYSPLVGGQGESQTFDGHRPQPLQRLRESCLDPADKLIVLQSSRLSSCGEHWLASRAGCLNYSGTFGAHSQNVALAVGIKLVLFILLGITF